MAPQSGLVGLFCHNLKRIRKAKGLTQADVASILGMTQGAYSHFEQRPSAATLTSVEKLALALQVQPHELLTPVAERMKAIAS